MEYEELAPDEKGAVPTHTHLAKDALSGVDRSVAIEDLAHIGVQKLVLDRLDKAERLVSSLDGTKSKLHATELQLAVTSANLTRLQNLDSMQSTLLGVGCLFLGFLPSTWGNHALTVVVAVGGVALTWASIISKKEAK